MCTMCVYLKPFFLSFSQVPPTFLNPEPEVLYLLPGDEITLNCTAIGNPAPMYSWQSSQPIQVGLKNEAAITSNSLLPGTYICTASNTLQKKIKKFTLRPKNKGKKELYNAFEHCVVVNIVYPNHCLCLFRFRCLN